MRSIFTAAGIGTCVGDDTKSNNLGRSKFGLRRRTEERDPTMQPSAAAHEKAKQRFEL